MELQLTDERDVNDEDDRDGDGVNNMGILSGMITPQKPNRNNNHNSSSSSSNSNHNSNNSGRSHSHSHSHKSNRDNRLPVDGDGDDVRGRVVGHSESYMTACAEVAQALLSSCTLSSNPPSSNAQFLFRTQNTVASRLLSTGRTDRGFYDDRQHALLATLARTSGRACLQLHASGALHRSYNGYTTNTTTATTTSSSLVTSTATTTATSIGMQTRASCLYGSSQPSPALDSFTRVTFAIMREEAAAAAAAAAGAVAKANARGSGSSGGSSSKGEEDDEDRSVCMAFVRGLLNRLGLAGNDRRSSSSSPSPGVSDIIPRHVQVRLVLLAGTAVEGLGLANPLVTEHIHKGLLRLLEQDLHTINNNHNNNTHPSPKEGEVAYFTLTHAISLALAQVTLAPMRTALGQKNTPSSPSSTEGYLGGVVDTLCSSFTQVLESPPPPAIGVGPRSADRPRLGVAELGQGLGQGQGSGRKANGDRNNHRHHLFSRSNNDAASVKSSASSSSSTPSTTPPPTTRPLSMTTPPSSKRSSTRASSLGGSVWKGLRTGLGAGLSPFGLSPKHPKITHNDDDSIGNNNDGDDGDDQIPLTPGSRPGSGLGTMTMDRGGGSPWLGALYGLTAGMLAVVRSVDRLAQAQELGLAQQLGLQTAASMNANAIIVTLQCRLTELFVATTGEVCRKEQGLPIILLLPSIHPMTHPQRHRLTYPLSHQLIYPLTHSLTHRLPHPLMHTLDTRSTASDQGLLTGPAG